MLIYLEKKAQIGAILFNKAFTKVLIKYCNYNNIFLVKNIAKLLKHIRTNDYIII